MPVLSLNNTFQEVPVVNDVGPVGHHRHHHRHQHRPEGSIEEEEAGGETLAQVINPKSFNLFKHLPLNAYLLL